MLPGAL